MVVTEQGFRGVQRCGMSKHSVRGRKWNVFRGLCIRKAGYKCQRCGRSGRLEVHHKNEVSKGGKAFDFDNVEVVCRGCHFAAHSEREPHYRDPVRAAWWKLINEGA